MQTVSTLEGNRATKKDKDPSKHKQPLRARAHLYTVASQRIKRGDTRDRRRRKEAHTAAGEIKKCAVFNEVEEGRERRQKDMLLLVCLSVFQEKPQ